MGGDGRPEGEGGDGHGDGVGHVGGLEALERAHGHVVWVLTAEEHHWLRGRIARTMLVVRITNCRQNIARRCKDRYSDDTFFL